MRDELGEQLLRAFVFQRVVRHRRLRRTRAKRRGARGERVARMQLRGRDGPLEHHPAVPPGRGPETTRGARRGDHAGGIRALRVAQGGQRGWGAHVDLTS